MALPAPSLDSVPSLGAEEPEAAEQQEGDDGASVDSGDGGSFEFAFAPPLIGAEGQRRAEAALADDIFLHGRILPAYPVFDRRLLAQEEPSSSSSSAVALPEPDTYCSWSPAPRSPAPGFPKSGSTGEPRRLRVRDVLVGSSGRSHSDGKEKFVFLQPSSPSPSPATEDKRSKKEPASPSPTPRQKQPAGKKKAAVTEMDMATAHRLFYSKAGAAAGAGERKQPTSYLTHRPAFVGFFAAVHAMGRCHHHPY